MEHVPRTGKRNHDQNKLHDGTHRGACIAGCTPDTTAIAWLRLGAVCSQGPGVFRGVTFIQRVNTIGGIAPSTAGTTIGQLANVAYTAEYYFYSATD